MKSSDLTTRQLQQLKASLRINLAYLTKLRQRMQANNFSVQDRLFRDAQIAEKVLGDMVSEIETYINYRRAKDVDDAFR